MKTPEEKARHRKASHEANREKENAQSRVYMKTHREEVRIREKAYRALHREEMRAKDKAYRVAHLEEVRARGRLAYARHREDKIARSKAYVEAHHEEIKVKSRMRYAAHREERREKGLVSRQKLKEEIFEHYGTECVCCGESMLPFLVIDHINNDGANHRKTLKGKNIYQWLKLNNFPDGFQTLCWNCNSAKGIYGLCPHQKEHEA